MVYYIDRCLIYIDRHSIGSKTGGLIFRPILLGMCWCVQIFLWLTSRTVSGLIKRRLCERRCCNRWTRLLDLVERAIKSIAVARCFYIPRRFWRRYLVTCWCFLFQWMTNVWTPDRAPSSLLPKVRTNGRALHSPRRIRELGPLIQTLHGWAEIIKMLSKPQELLKIRLLSPRGHGKK